MRDAVEEAGFSVAQFSMTIGFNHLQLSSDHIFKISNLTFYVMKGEGIILDQDVEFVFLDQGFMIDKRMKELESELGVVLRKKKKNNEPNKFRVMIKKDREHVSSFLLSVFSSLCLFTASIRTGIICIYKSCF
jgi:hypothetical protein